MERQEIPIRFAELRQLTETVPTYLAQKVGVRATPLLKAGLEYEFGIAGLDTESLLLEFAETYRVDVTAFDFTGLISPEGPDLWDTIWFFPLATYLLTGWLLRTVVVLLCWPFNRHLAQRIWQQQLPRFWRSADGQAQPKALTIGDFVASAAVGRFVRREQVYFRLVC